MNQALNLAKKNYNKIQFCPDKSTKLVQISTRNELNSIEFKVFQHWKAFKTNEFRLSRVEFSVDSG